MSNGSAPSGSGFCPGWMNTNSAAGTVTLTQREGQQGS
jgi:hypothetical protein